MRIVSGKFRGRTLLTFDGFDIRPTSDKVRESLFNILQFKIPDSDFLDLYCGTGAMGIEALSRGANYVLLNDLNRDSVMLAKKNIEKIGNPEGIEVVKSDACALLDTTAKRFDVVYIDPPYKGGFNVISVEKSKRVLKDGGIIILESETPFEESILGLEKYDQRKYGRAYLTFFKREEK